jgi:hypothetical protein
MTVTTEQALKQQEDDADRRQRKAEFVQGSFAAPARTNGGTALTVPSNKTAVSAYLDEIAPSGIVGRMIKFDKNGEFVTSDDDGKIGEETDFVALTDQTLVGWIRFNDDAPPSRAAGLLYDGFIMPSRDSLGDTDESKWPIGLNGRPEDPWKHQICLVLQHGDNGRAPYVRHNLGNRPARHWQLAAPLRSDAAHESWRAASRSTQKGWLPTQGRAGWLGCHAGVRRRRARAKG